MTRVIVSQPGPQGPPGPTVSTGAITTDKLADAAVTGVKIAAGAVDTSRLGTGAVDNSKVASGAAIDKTKISGTAVIESRQVATGGPLSGGGDLSANRTLTVATAAITPIYLGLTYAAKSAGYTLTDDDYEVDFTAAPYTATLPNAVGRAGRVFIVRNSASSGTVTVSGASTTLPGPGYVVVRSNGTTWNVIEGAYADASAGLASYRWNAASAAWRLIAYDSGIRNITADLANGWAAGGGGYVYVRRTTSHTTVSIYYITGASATSATFITLASGFQFTPTLNALARTNSGTNALVVATSTMTFTGSYTSYADVEATLSGPATPTLPTSLPGTTVTSPV